MEGIYKALKCLNEWDKGSFELVSKSSLRDDYELKYNNKRIVSGPLYQVGYYIAGIYAYLKIKLGE